MTRAPKRRAADAVATSSPDPAGAAPPLIEIPEEIKPSVRLHLRLATCRNLLMREARLSVERWGLTLPQFDVLAELSRAKGEGFTFVELSRLLLVTSGNLTGIVDRLQAEGLVRRQTDVRDRRLVRIVLTKKGRRLAQDIMPRHAQDIHALLSFLPSEQVAALIEMLGRLRDGLRARSREPAEARAGARANSRTSPARARTRPGRAAARFTTSRERGAALAAHVAAVTRHD
jgi:DNA-binding MarR family transcriptional regulator